MTEPLYESIDEIIELIKDMSIEDIVAELPDGPRLISRDELLAAGALDVPPSWRKHLGGRKPSADPKQRDLFAGLDDDAGHEEPTPEDTDDDVSDDEPE